MRIQSNQPGDINKWAAAIILKALFILTKYKPELCIQKQFYIPLLWNNPLQPSEENTINRPNYGGLL